MELTNALRKSVAALDDARHRRETGLFKVEGTKCVSDTFGHFTLRHLIASAAWLESHPGIAGKAGAAIVAAPRREFQRMSHLSMPPEVIAVYEIPDNDITPSDIKGSLAIALDGVQDPGNLGTIVRTADWFGITDVICSHDCADPYSPKAVMATMGALSRVRVTRCDLPAFIAGYDGPVYGTALDGENIYSASLSGSALIVMGSEGHGLSPEVSAAVTCKLRIPAYPEGRECSESLNVGIATAIVVAEFRRSISNK